MISRTQVEKLKATGKVDDVENEGMDEGRFFVHLTQAWEYPPPYYGQRTKSFGSFREAQAMVKRAIRKEVA